MYSELPRFDDERSLNYFNFKEISLFDVPKTNRKADDQKFALGVLVISKSKVLSPLTHGPTRILHCDAWLGLPVFYRTNSCDS